MDIRDNMFKKLMLVDSEFKYSERILKVMLTNLMSIESQIQIQQDSQGILVREEIAFY